MKVWHTVAVGAAGGIALAGVFYFVVFSFMQAIIGIALMLLAGGNG